MALVKNFRRAAVGVIATSALVVAGLSPAGATQGRNDSKQQKQTEYTHGSKKPIKTFKVELQPHSTCVLTVRNQHSVHPETNVKVQVGNKTHTLKNVEGKANKVTTAKIIVGAQTWAMATVLPGPDGVSSLKSQDVACEKSEPLPKPEPKQTFELSLKPNSVCVLTVRNQNSVHPQTNVVVQVGKTSYTLQDVEGEADKVTTLEIAVDSTTTATATVIVGPDGVSSLKSQDVTCEPKPEPKPEPEPEPKPEPEKPTFELPVEPDVCVLTIRNQGSVHPGTNVEVKVGDKTYLLKDVEATADKVTTLEIPVASKTTAIVTVIVGPDGVSSLKSQDVTCEPLPEPEPEPEDPDVATPPTPVPTEPKKTG